MDNNKQNPFQDLSGLGIVALANQAVKVSQLSTCAFNPSLELINKDPEVSEAGDDKAD